VSFVHYVAMCCNLDKRTASSAISLSESICLRSRQMFQIHVAEDMNHLPPKPRTFYRDLAAGNSCPTEPTSSIHTNKHLMLHLHSSSWAQVKSRFAKLAFISLKRLKTNARFTKVDSAIQCFGTPKAS